MNTLKDKLASGAVTRGLWQNLPGPELAELVAHAGFDWLVIDGEHGAWDPADIRARLIAAPDAAALKSHDAGIACSAGGAILPAGPRQGHSRGSWGNNRQGEA